MTTRGKSRFDAKGKNLELPRIIPYAVVFCDDIRREINGKELLVGVYSGELVVPQVPHILSIALFIQVKVPETIGNYKNKLRVVDPSGNKAGETDLEHNVTAIHVHLKNRVTAFPMPPLVISINQPGTIKVYWANENEEFSLIGEKWVITGPVPSAFSPPSAPPPPAAPAS